MSMKEALDRSGLQPSDIGYINAHGTATINNDLSEGIAVQNLFGQNIPPISSTKAFTGHLLGAAGAAEAVFSVLSLQQNLAWPNLNFEVQMKELSFSPCPLVSLSPAPLVSQSPGPLVSQSPGPLVSKSPAPLVSQFPGPLVPLSGSYRHVLSNSFGFGGNNTTLIFSKTTL
jgi:3-oxoacyl-(acyl-carrier-protein) synthase